MRKINFQECPICEKEILSDATTKSYCRLCGMNIDNLNAYVKMLVGGRTEKAFNIKEIKTTLNKFKPLSLVL